MGCDGNRSSERRAEEGERRVESRGGEGGSLSRARQAKGEGGGREGKGTVERRGGPHCTRATEEREDAVDSIRSNLNEATKCESTSSLSTILYSLENEMSSSLLHNRASRWLKRDETHAPKKFGRG